MLPIPPGVHYPAIHHPVYTTRPYTTRVDNLGYTPPVLITWAIHHPGEIYPAIHHPGEIYPAIHHPWYTLVYTPPVVYPGLCTTLGTPHTQHGTSWHGTAWSTLTQREERRPWAQCGRFPWVRSLCAS